MQLRIDDSSLKTTSKSGLSYSTTTADAVVDPLMTNSERKNATGGAGLQHSSSNPLYSQIIGGGVVSSLAEGISTMKDRFPTALMLTEEFRLNKARSIEEISKQFDQYRYHCRQKKKNTKHFRSFSGLDLTGADLITVVEPDEKPTMSSKFQTSSLGTRKVSHEEK